MIAKTSNPVLTRKVFGRTYTDAADDTVMTLNGTVNKSFLMILLVILGAAYTWRIFFQNPDPEAIPSSLLIYGLVGVIGGFILSMVIIFHPVSARWAAPVYAVMEGLFLGSISAIFEFLSKGIVIQAAGLTFLTLATMLFLYRSGIIKVTQKFRMGLYAALGPLCCYTSRELYFRCPECISRSYMRAEPWGS